jgi:hypothetical protein
MFVFEFFNAIFKFYAILGAVPPQCSFGPLLTKAIRLIDGGDKDGIDSRTQQIKKDATDEQIKQKKKL